MVIVIYHVLSGHFSQTMKEKRDDLQTENYKTNNMKHYLLIFALLLGAVSSWGLDLSKDFVVIDANCPNSCLVNAQYQGQPNVVVISMSQTMPPLQVTKVLNGKQLTDLHLFVSVVVGTLGFCNIPLNPDNNQQPATALSNWASHVRGTAFINGTHVYSPACGLEFKAKLEQITGLTLTIQ